MQKYPQLFQQIHADVNQIPSISIFQKDAYRTKETAAAAEVFADMQAVQVAYYPAAGRNQAGPFESTRARQT